MLGLNRLRSNGGVIDRRVYIWIQMTLHETYTLTGTILVPTVPVSLLIKERKKAATAPSTPAVPKAPNPAASPVAT
jgi:hypothetical protein